MPRVNQCQTDTAEPEIKGAEAVFLGAASEAVLS